MKKTKNYIMTVLGIVLVLLGLYFIKSVDNPKEFLLALPYVCIGVGGGAFGYGMGNLVSDKAIQNYPDIKRQKEIEEKDERNIAISSRAKDYDLCLWSTDGFLCSYGC